MACEAGDDVPLAAGDPFDVVVVAPAGGDDDVGGPPLFGPRGGILSSTFDFFVTVSVVLCACDTYPPFSTKTRSY